MYTAAQRKEKFRVSIRKQQIEGYMKSRRAQMTQYIETKIEDEEKYRGVYSRNCWEGLLTLDKEQIQCHLQMMTQVLASDMSDKFYEEFQPALCAIVDFFQKSYTEWFTRIEQRMSQLGEQKDDDAVRMVVLNKLLQFFTPNSLLKFIGMTYYTIVAHNLHLLKKVVILLRQMLQFSMTTHAQLTYNIKIADQKDQPVELSEQYRNQILLSLMNITFSEEYAILRIVYEENIIQNLSQWIVQRGFKENERESIAGIYRNMIDYLCSLVGNSPHQMMETYEQEEPTDDYYFFMPLFEQLLKSTQSDYIIQQLVVVSVQMLKIFHVAQMNCVTYVLTLIEELIRNMVCKKKYFPRSQQLFIVFVEQYRLSSYIEWLMQFLVIIVQKESMIYYKNNNKDNKQKMAMHQEHRHSSRGLKYIGRLIDSCTLLLKIYNEKSQLEGSNQEVIVRELVDLWCKEELVDFHSQFLEFLVTALTSQINLVHFCFQNQLVLECIITTLNTSYLNLNQIQKSMKLASIFLSRLNGLESNPKLNIIYNYNSELDQIKIRMQDYLITVNNNHINCLKMVEINIEQLTTLIQNCDTI